MAEMAVESSQRASEEIFRQFREDVMRKEPVRTPEVPPDSARMFLIRGRILDNGCICGVTYSFWKKTAEPFWGLAQAVYKMNCWMDEWGGGSERMELRTFDTGRRPGRKSAGKDSGEKTEESGFLPKPLTGRMENILVQVLYRQNASWQGEVRWRNQRRYFRSAMELTVLIHSALV